MKDLGVKIELGQGLGVNGRSIQSLKEEGYESIFIGIGKKTLLNC